MAFQWNISLVVNFERQKLVFKTLHSARKYIKMIFKNMWLLFHLHFEKHKQWQLKLPISARHWSVLAAIIYERLYKGRKGQTYHQCEIHLIYVLSPEQKIIKNIPVIIKQFKDIINTNNSFLRAKADYVKETYLQKQKVRSHSRIATTTKQKLYGMNLVATEHKLKFL